MINFRTQAYLKNVVFAGYVRQRSWLERVIHSTFQAKYTVIMHNTTIPFMSLV